MAAGREEMLAKSSSSSRSDKQFDTIIGHIEDIIVGDDFQTLQQTFMDKHYMVFDDAEENKLVYTEIHQKYVHTIEQYLEMQLKQRMAGFKMSDFQKLLLSRKHELDGEVFEMLLTFTDFLSFKELMLDYKAVKEGKNAEFGAFIIHGVSNANASDAGSSQPCSSSITDSEPMRISLEFNSNDNDDDDAVDEIDVSDGDADGSEDLGDTELATDNQLNDDMGLLVIGTRINPLPPS